MITQFQCHMTLCDITKYETHLGKFCAMYCTADVDEIGFGKILKYFGPKLDYILLIRIFLQTIMIFIQSFKFHSLVTPINMKDKSKVYKTVLSLLTKHSLGNTRR